jgi:hypothetical protein
VIRFNDRITVLGSTGRGKSVLINYLFSTMNGGAQRLLVDTKHEFAIPDVPIARSPEQLDWRLPVLHYQDSGGGAEEIGELFDACYGRRRLLVAVHELSDVCEFRAGKTPRAFNEYLSKGRARGLGLLAGTQRPVDIPSRALTEAEHLFVMAPGFTRPSDQASIGGAVGRNAHEVARVLEEAARTESLGSHPFLHYDRAAAQLLICPALDEGEQSAITVQTPTLY